jgi:hypothetical protein
MIVKNVNIVKALKNDTNNINGNNPLNIRNKFSLFLHSENNVSIFVPLKIPEWP